MVSVRVEGRERERERGGRREGKREEREVRVYKKNETHEWKRRCM